MDHVNLNVECWVAVALLQRENPGRQSFKPSEIRRRIQEEHLFPELRAGIPAHLSQHMVANVKPVSGRYRMLYKTSDGRLRLFRKGDDFHRDRNEKIRPEPEEMPQRHRDLVRWYDEEFNRAAPHENPLLAMQGVGKDMWSKIDADAYVDELRAGWQRLPMHK